VIARALAVGIICAPFISAALLGLHRAGHALHTRLTRRRPAVTFRYRDSNGQQLEVTPAIHLHDGQPAVEFFIPLTATNPTQAGRVYIPLDRLEELVAGLRDTGRQAAGGAS
jgi:hypothetical protein